MKNEERAKPRRGVFSFFILPSALGQRAGVRGAQGVLVLLLLLTAWRSLGAETNAPPPFPAQVEATNLQAVLAGFAQLQEQLRAAQAAIEDNRKAIKDAAAQNAETVSQALQTVQQTFVTQRARDLEAMRSSNKVILIVAGTFAAIGFLTLLMMSYFQWRMSQGLDQITAALPAALGLGAGAEATTLGLTEQPKAPLLAAKAQPRGPAYRPEPALRPGPTPRAAGRPPLQGLIMPAPRIAFRRGHVRPMRTALIVGVLCAAALALLLYLVAFRKLGLDYLHDLFKG
jgi:hypothetical protein